MTIPTRIRFRLLAGCALLLHLAVAGVGPMADAIAEARAGDEPAATHVEAEGRSCPSHDHLFCQLCRVVGADLVPTGSAVPGFGAANAVDRGLPTCAVRPPAATPLLPRQARAPPLV